MLTRKVGLFATLLLELSPSNLLVAQVIISIM